MWSFFFFFAFCKLIKPHQNWQKEPNWELNILRDAAVFFIFVVILLAIIFFQQFWSFSNEMATWHLIFARQIIFSFNFLKVIRVWQLCICLCVSGLTWLVVCLVCWYLISWLKNKREAVHSGQVTLAYKHSLWMKHKTCTG